MILSHDLPHYSAVSSECLEGHNSDVRPTKKENLQRGIERRIDWMQALADIIRYKRNADKYIDEKMCWGWNDGI